MDADEALSLVIFDVDGTLVDSQHVIQDAMEAAFAAAGRAAPEAEAVRAIIGLSLPVAMGRLAPGAGADEVAALTAGYKQAYASRRAALAGGADAPLFPGARAALAALQARRRLLSVATGKSRRGLDHMIAAHGLQGVFSFPQTADDAPSKPHPQMVETCIALHGVAPGRAVMIGDTTYDIEMARAAGARTIGVEWGYHPADALRAAGADLMIGAFAQLAGAVAELLEDR